MDSHRSHQIDRSKFSYYCKTDDNLFEEPKTQRTNNTQNYIQNPTFKDEFFQKYYLNIYSLDYTLYQQILNYCSSISYIFYIIFNQFCVNMIYGFHITIIGIIMIPYKKHTEFNMLEIILVTNSFFLGSAIGAASISYQYNIVNNRRTLILINLIFIMFHTFMFSFLVQFTVVLLIRFLIGFHFGFVQPVVNNLIVESIPPKYINVVFIIGYGITTGFAGEIVLFSQLIIMPNLESTKIQELLLVMSLFLLFIFLMLF